MSLFRRTGMTKTGPLKALVALLLVTPLLASCGSGGFRPLHGPTASGEDMVEVLAGIDVLKIPSRVGQQLRNEIIFHTTGGDYPGEPRYTLSIAIRESVATTLVRRSGESLGQVYNLDASFELTDIKTKKVILRGKSYGRAGFERFVSSYSNVRARLDAENRAAKTIGREIRNRLAAFLAQHV